MIYRPSRKACKRKRKHLSASNAEIIKKWRSSHNPSFKSNEVYFCDWCGYYHLGRK